MTIADLGAQPDDLREQAADLLVEGFDHPQGCPDREAATNEMERLIRRGFAFAARLGHLHRGCFRGPARPQQHFLDHIRPFR